MTTPSHRQPDWKVTRGRRVMVNVGWAIVALSVYLAFAATFTGLDEMWWVVAGLALLGMLVAVTLPEPVPRDLIMERQRWVDSRSAR